MINELYQVVSNAENTNYSKALYYQGFGEFTFSMQDFLSTFYFFIHTTWEEQVNWPFMYIQF